MRPPTDEELKFAFMHSGNSSTGPDGIPAVLYRRVPKVAVPLLISLVQFMYDRDGPTVQLALPGKEPGLLDNSVGRVLATTDKTRPISVHNICIRIISSAFRPQTEIAAKSICSAEQTGFLLGTEANILALDTTLHHYKKRKVRGGVFSWRYSLSIPFHPPRLYLIITFAQ